MESEPIAIIVLPDGETWSTVSGCTLKVIDAVSFTDLCNDRISADTVDIIYELEIK